MKKICVIVLNYNGENDTQECILSLENSQKTLDYELTIVIVDNKSKIDMSTDVKSIDKNIIFIKNKENLGYAGGNNVGIQYALEKEQDYILLLNNDTIIDKDAIFEMYKTADSNSSVGIVSPKIYFAKGYEFHKNRYKKSDLGKVIWYVGGLMDWNNLIGHHRGVDEVDRGQYDKRVEIELASGNCLFVRSDVFRKVGLLNTKYFLYYEDADFSMRVKKANFKIIYEPKAFLWHKNAVSAGGSGSVLQDYYITRNRMLFGMKYASFRTKMALLKEGIMILTRGRKWQKKGVQDFYLSNFYKGSFPLD